MKKDAPPLKSADPGTARAEKQGRCAPMADGPDTRRIRNFIRKMPTLPPAAAKVLKICNQADPSPAELSRIISLDPVLTGSLMRLINSAYYGLNQEVTSVVRAIVLLGANTVKNLVLSTAVLSRLSKLKGKGPLNMDDFWQHSLGVAVMAKMTAREAGIAPARLEGFFIAGLLHDVGKIPMSAGAGDVYESVLADARQTPRPLFLSERERLGADHSAVGCIIADHWSLGDDLADAISHHHHDTYSGAFREIVYVTALANRFANFSGIGASGDMPDSGALEARAAGTLPDEAAEHLKVSAELTDEKREAAFREIEKARVFLNV